MKYSFILFILIIVSANAYGQFHNPWTQYNQVPSLQNAGLTGVEGFTDIKVGFKKQWTAFEGAPSNYFVGANHPIALREVSDASALEGQVKRSLRLGVGGYISESTYNFINDTNLGLSCAVHVPVSSEYYLSLGIATNYDRIKVDTRELVIRDRQDQFYLDLVGSGGSVRYFNLDAGLALYSQKLYAGYASQRLVRNRLNDELAGKEKSDIRHTVLFGYNYSLNALWDLQPCLLLRYESALEETYNVALKARYHDQLWAGISWSPDESLSILSGYKINSNLTLAYSYDFSMGEIRTASSGNHEVIIGIMPFNKSGNQNFW